MKARQSNIELLRIVLMCMIVLGHLVIHGYPSSDFLIDQSGSNSNLWKIFAYVLCSGAVDCFVFISGYYGIRTCGKSVFSYVFTIVYYAIITYVVYHFYVLQQGLDSLFTWDVFCQIVNVGGRWWFVFAYMGVMLLAPFINAGFEKLDRKEQLLSVVAMFLIYSSGIRYITHSYIEFLPMMLFMYMLGRYLRNNPVKFLYKYSGWIYLFCVCCLLLQQYFFVLTENSDRNIMIYVASHANPICILIGVSLFYTFQKMQIPQSRCINLIASGTFAAYLITDGFLREKINGWIVRHIDYGFVSLLVISIGIVILCSLFDMIKRYILQSIDNQLLITPPPCKRNAGVNRL